MDMRTVREASTDPPSRRPEPRSVASRWRLSTGLSTALAAAACGEESPAPANLATCTEGEAQVVLLSELRFGRPIDGTSPGFDLDGAATAAGDPTGCGAPDYAAGVDNALAALLPALEATEAGAAEPLIQAAINEGGLQVILRWTGVDDPQDDACVTDESLSGAGPVYIGTHDRVLPNQTLVVDETAPVSVASEGSLADGTLEAGPFELSVPFRVLDADIDLVILDGRVRLTPDGLGGYDGVVGGGVDIAQVIATLEPLGIDRGVISLLGVLLDGAADLDPDGDGVCSRMSVALVVKAVPVFLFDEADGG